MADVRFLELYRCAGVDETAQPAAMVVPLDGSNLVVLETAGVDLSVEVDPKNHLAIRLEELDGKDITRALNELRNRLLRPEADSQERAAFLPNTSWEKPRFFRVHGKAKTGFPGVRVRAVPKPVAGRRAAPIGAALRVVVLDPMVIKVAISRVWARDQYLGNLIFHSRRIPDPKLETQNMNFIWTAQTNIAFELIPSTDVAIDHNDPSIQAELKKAYGSTTFYAESEVSAAYHSKTWELFASRKVPGAHLTFFCVHKVMEHDRTVANGVTSARRGIALISGTHLPATYAHEAGHFVGGSVVNGEWFGLPHPYDEDIRLLMRRGGSGWKIPFGEVQTFRGFFDRHPVH